MNIIDAIIEKCHEKPSRIIRLLIFGPPGLVLGVMGAVLVIYGLCIEAVGGLCGAGFEWCEKKIGR